MMDGNWFKRLNKAQQNELYEKLRSLEKTINGGDGSGNFGHAGRKGKVGGSSSKSGGSKSKLDMTDDEIRSMAERIGEPYEDLKRYMEESEVYKGLSDEQKQMRRDVLQEIAGISEYDDFYSPDVQMKMKETKMSEFQIESERKSLQNRLGLEKSDFAELKGEKASKEQLAELGSLFSGYNSEMTKEFAENSLSKESADILINEVKAFGEEYGLNTSDYDLQFFTDKAAVGGWCAMTDTGKATLGFNRVAMAETERTDKNCRKAYDDGILTGDEGIRNIFRHELGHLKVTDNMRKDNIPLYEYDLYNSFIIRDAVREYIGVEEKLRMYSISSSGHQAVKNKMDEMMYKEKGMSKYGRSKDSEAVAEALSNPNYSELTKIIAKKVKQGVKIEDYATFLDKTVAEIQAEGENFYKNSYRSRRNMLCDGLPLTEEMLQEIEQ